MTEAAMMTWLESHGYLFVGTYREIGGRAGLIFTNDAAEEDAVVTLDEHDQARVRCGSRSNRDYRVDRTWIVELDQLPADKRYAHIMKHISGTLSSACKA